MPIAYALDPELTAAEFRAVPIASTLGERRPVDQPARLEQMLRNADVMVTAREGGKLACQNQGIGKRLMEKTQQAAGEQAMRMLIAAPAAEGYYPKIGMQPIKSGWLIPRNG